MSKQQEDVRQVFFKFYDDYAESYVKYLTGDQLKALILSLVDFHRDGVIADFSGDPVVAMAFNAICGNIMRDEKKYVDAVRRKREQRDRQAKEHAEQQTNSQTATTGFYDMFREASSRKV